MDWPLGVERRTNNNESRAVSIERTLRVVHLKLRDLRELMEGYLPMVQPHGGYFWRTRQELVAGEELVLELEVLSIHKTFAIECVTVDSLRSLGLPCSPGFALAFKPAEAELVEEMLRTVSWNLIGSNRRLHLRYPAALPVAWSTDDSGAMQVGHTENISLGGAFVRCAILPEEESLITLYLRHESFGAPVAIPARVAWLRRKESPGMGVQFLYDSRDTLTRIQAILDRSNSTVRQ